MHGIYKDILSGLLFIIFGIIFMFYSLRYDFGNFSNLGPGFFPFTVSVLLILLGVFLVFRK